MNWPRLIFDNDILSIDDDDYGDVVVGDDGKDRDDDLIITNTIIIHFNSIKTPCCMLSFTIRFS